MVKDGSKEIVYLTKHSTHLSYGYMMSDIIMVKDGRKEIVYLTKHSTHFIYGHMSSDVLRHMAKDHSEREDTNC